ncbi:MAG: P-II family nitrogen regulator [Gemmatimonadaceae bacterium]
MSHDLTRLDDVTGNADDLWLITAIIQPFKLEALTLALAAQPGFGGMTVAECRGFGRDKVSRMRLAGGGPGRSGDAEPAGPAPGGGGDADLSDVVDYTKKTRIDVAVSGQERALQVARTIARVAHTGRGGDGKLFISRLTGVIGIRGFDVDHDAL